MSSSPSSKLWEEAYKRFEQDSVKLLEDFEDVIHKRNPTGQQIRLGTEHSQKQLVAFINAKMKLSQQQSSKSPAFQRTIKTLAKPKDLMLTASAASPPVNAALAGIFLAFSMAELYSSEKTARSDTAYRLAKTFIRRKAACGRVYSQSPNEPEGLRDLRGSLHISYVDLYHAILTATAKLVCALDDSRWEKRCLRRVQMAFGWSEWAAVHAELEALEDAIKYDEDEIRSYGNMGPWTPAAAAPVAQPAAAPPPPPPVTATSVRRGRNALHTAAVNNDLATVQDLLNSNKFDINARTKRRWTALSFAAEKGFLDVAKLILLAPGVNYNAQNDEGNTAIHLTAINQRLPQDRRVAVIKLLTSHGAKADMRNNSKRTAFLDAAKQGNLKIVQVLKQNGADINQVTGVNGWSALHEAAGKGHLDVVKWLVAKKIDTKIKTSGGNMRDKTAVQIARKRADDESDAAKKKRYEEIAKCIEAAEAAPKPKK